MYIFTAFVLSFLFSKAKAVFRSQGNVRFISQQRYLKESVEIHILTLKAMTSIVGFLYSGGMLVPLVHPLFLYSLV